MANELRVMHVIPTLTGGGAENFVSSLVPRLHGEQMECSIMTIYPSETPVEIPRGDGPRIIPIERAGRYDPIFFPRMVSAMRAWRPTVVHTHMHNGKYWGRVAALAAGVHAIVHTVHNPCDTDRMMIEPFVDRMLNANSVLVTFCNQQREFLARLERVPLERITVIPNGITHHSPNTQKDRAAVRHRFGLEQDQYAIFVIGRLQKQKNQRLAVEAMAELPPFLRERIRLYIIGSGVDRHSLVQLIEEHGLERSVGLLGHRPDVAELLSAADMVFLPSLTEGMPLVMLEAMSAGVPVLSTPWIGAHDVLAGGALGTLTPDWKPASVARCFARMYENRAELQGLAAIAQTHVRGAYDIAATAEKHRELYRRLTIGEQAA